MNIEMFLNDLRQGKPIAKDSNEQQLKIGRAHV